MNKSPEEVVVGVEGMCTCQKPSCGKEFSRYGGSCTSWCIECAEEEREREDN